MVSWKELAEDPFGFVDRINLRYKGKDFNLVHDDVGIRKIAFWFAVVCGVLWLIQGIDSTPLQLIYVGYAGLPGFFLGHLNWSQVVAIYNYYYGKEMHYSAFVIYVFLYWGLSRNWARVGVTKTKNVIYSFAAMFLAIGLFEWFWMYSFSTFQHQPWVVTWRWPQFRILFQNTWFTFGGVLAAFYMWIDSYILKNKEILGRLWIFPWRSWKLWLILGLSAAAALLWIYYPWPTHQFSVLLNNGQVWHSSKLFPQTLYTIDKNPGGPVNAGDWYYFQNDFVHGLNTLVKFLWALSIYLFFKVRAPEK
jgi:hypothetical protein